MLRPINSWCPSLKLKTASVLRKLYLEKWVNWAGPPKEVILDPARTNLGKAMVEPTELEGTHVFGGPQAGGPLANLVRQKFMVVGFHVCCLKFWNRKSPENKEEWLEWVIQSHVKNQMIQNYGYTPSQFHIWQDDQSLRGALIARPRRDKTLQFRRCCRLLAWSEMEQRPSVSGWPLVW